MTDDHPIIAALPEEARSTFARLMERAVRSPDAMREQIPHYMTAIERAAATGYGPPLSVGKAIAADCEALLDAWDKLDDNGRRLVRAAVEYFLLSGTGTTTSPPPRGWTTTPRWSKRCALTSGSDTSGSPGAVIPSNGSLRRRRSPDPTHEFSQLPDP